VHLDDQAIRAGRYGGTRHRRDLVPSLSMAAAAAGADGLLVEVHPEPEKAICDGPQQLRTSDFGDYLRQVERVAEIAGKELAGAL